jgi:hypothetical protein
MPKKKLTKAQVKRKLKSMYNAAYDLTIDKMGHGSNSFVPMSFVKINEILTQILRSQSRVK